MRRETLKAIETARDNLMQVGFWLKIKKSLQNSFQLLFPLIKCCSGAETKQDEDAWCFEPPQQQQGQAPGQHQVMKK